MEHHQHPSPYTRSLGGRGQIYLQDCLIPLARHYGTAEFSFCDMDSLLSGGCLTARKMFSQMKEAGFIVISKNTTSKQVKYILHPDVFRIINEHASHSATGIANAGLRLSRRIDRPALILQ